MRRVHALASIFAIIITALFSGLPTHAEEASVKRELALELIRVAGGGDMARQLSQIMLASMRQNYSSMVQQLISSQPSLSPEQRVAVEKQLSNYDRFAAKFSSRFSEAIDFDQILQQVYVPLYVEHFTETELREILEFQSSPVGQKAASKMPQLMQQGMAATLPTIQPIIMSITHEIFLEEQALALRESD
jgi:hypothetical protein